MALLDQYGSPYRYTNKFADASDRSSNRGPQWPNLLDDLAVLVPQHDRMTLQALSRRLYTNFGVCKAAVNQKATYSVGSSFLPVWQSADAAAGAEARAWVLDRFYPLCELRGPAFYFQESLRLISQAIDRDGEAYVLLTESKGGDPRIQLIPAHRIGQRDSGETNPGGAYGGLEINDGVVTNKFGRAVAYRVLGNESDGSKDKDVSARDLLHAYDPDFQEQLRGLPAFTHALTDFLHCIRSTEYERIAQLIVSSLGLIEYNEAGGPDFDDVAVALQRGETNRSGITTETYAGGSVRYYKANSGSKLESITHSRPGDLWERFHDRLIPSALAGVQWPMSLIWKAAGQGTAERSEVVRARRAVKERQECLKMVARRIVVYAVGKAMDRGELKPFKRFWDIGFTVPPRLTVDDGREIVGLLKAYEAGALNMSEIQGYKGRTVEQHWTERANDAADRKRIAAEVSAATGQDVTDADMGGDEPQQNQENAND